MQERKKGCKIAFVILFGIVWMFLLALFLWLQIKQKPEQLAKEKMAVMQKNKENTVQEGNEKQLSAEGTAYTAEISSFHISKETLPEKIPDSWQQDEDYPDSWQQDEDHPDRSQIQDGDTENEEDSGYLCSYSSDCLLDESDIEYLKQSADTELPANETMIQMVINEMYARYGYEFKNKEIQQYFEDKQWYQDITERTQDMAQVFGKMTNMEQENVRFLSAHMEE